MSLFQLLSSTLLHMVPVPKLCLACVTRSSAALGLLYFLFDRQRQVRDRDAEMFFLWKSAESYFDSRDPVIPRFWIIQKTYLDVSKKYKKIMHILNNIYYNRKNFQCKILRGLSNTKITKVGDLKLYTVRSVRLLFLCSSNPKLFCIENLHDYNIYYWEHVWVFKIF